MKNVTEIDSTKLNDAEYLGLLQAFVKIGENAAKGPLSSHFEAFKAMVESYARHLANKKSRPKRLLQILASLRIKLYSKLCKACQEAEKSGLLKKAIPEDKCNSIMAKCVSVKNLSDEETSNAIVALYREFCHSVTFDPQMREIHDIALNLHYLEFVYQICKTLCYKDCVMYTLKKLNVYRRECIYMYNFLMNHAEIYSFTNGEKNSKEFIRLVNAEIKRHKGLGVRHSEAYCVHLADYVNVGTK